MLTTGCMQWLHSPSHFTLMISCFHSLSFLLKTVVCCLPLQVAQLINYAKNLHEEEKHVVRTLRLQQDTIW